MDILDALEHRFNVPAYPRRVLSDYLNNRGLIYKTIEDQRVRDWLFENGLELAVDKIELVVLTRQRGFPETLRRHIGGTDVRAGNAVKY